MKKIIPTRHYERFFFGLVIIAAVTYCIMVINIIYPLEIAPFYIAIPILFYVLFNLIYVFYLRLKLWYEILTIWFDRNSEDERNEY